MDIQIYADKMKVEAESTLNVHLDGVDISQVVAEFNAQDVLEALDFEDIEEYYLSQVED